MPSLSSAERRSESVLGLMPTSERSSSLKRLVPVVRSRMMSNVHLPLTMLAVRATGHTSESLSSQVLAAVAVSSASALRRAMSLLLRRYRNLVRVNARSMQVAALCAATVHVMILIFRTIQNDTAHLARCKGDISAEAMPILASSGLEYRKTSGLALTEACSRDSGNLPHPRMLGPC